MANRTSPFRLLLLCILFAFPSCTLCYGQRFNAERAYRNARGLTSTQERNIENAVMKAMREYELKLKAQENAEKAQKKATETGKEAIATVNYLNQGLNYITPEDFMERQYISVDNQPTINSAQVRNSFNTDPNDLDFPTSILGDNAYNIDYILSAYDIETLKNDLIPSLRERLWEDYNELANTTPGSERAISLEKDIWTCEQDLQSFEDAVKLGDNHNNWAQNYPPQEIEHEQGTLYFSREVVEDVLNPMSEQDFLNYCQNANKKIKEKYAGYSDYYMAESCEIINGQLVSRIFYTSIPPKNTVVNKNDVLNNNQVSSIKKISEIERAIKEKKFELAKKLRTIDAYEQYQYSLDKDILANYVYILDDLTQVVKKQLNFKISRFIDTPLGTKELEKSIENPINDKKDKFLDDGIQFYYNYFDVQRRVEDNNSIEVVDNAVQGYNDINTVYGYAKKMVNAAGILDKDIPKQFERDMKALDSYFGHVPSKVKGAVGKYMFFLSNRYELGSSIGLAGANIAIYGMKNENQQFLEQKGREAQQLRSDIQHLEEEKQRLLKVKTISH